MSDSFTTPWTVALQAPLSMGFSRQKYWSGLSFPSPGDLPEPGIKPASPSLAGRFFATEPPGESRYLSYRISKENRDYHRRTLPSGERAHFQSHSGWLYRMRWKCAFVLSFLFLILEHDRVRLILSFPTGLPERFSIHL